MLFLLLWNDVAFSKSGTIPRKKRWKYAACSKIDKNYHLVPTLIYWYDISALELVHRQYEENKKYD